MEEKHPDTTGQAPTYDGEHEGNGYGGNSRRKSAVEEGAVIMGDVGTVEKYGYVERG
jgi:hypothetical protein